MYMSSCTMVVSILLDWPLICSNPGYALERREGQLDLPELGVRRCPPPGAQGSSLPPCPELRARRCPPPGGSPAPPPGARAPLVTKGGGEKWGQRKSDAPEERVWQWRRSGARERKNREEVWQWRRSGEGRVGIYLVTACWSHLSYEK